jgi:hypothetical protein
MTDYEVTPIPPPGLGEVLASPSAYAEAMIAGQALPFPHRARHRKPSRHVIRKALGASLAIAAMAGGLTLAAPASQAHASVTARPAVTVDTPVVHGGGYVKLSIRFGACVRNVRAWVTSGDDGPANTRVNRVDRSEAAPGSVFTVYVSINAADAQSMPGTWSVTSVQATACGTGSPVAIDYPNPVFQVAP